jgi:putative Holliday junction resolvase
MALDVGTKTIGIALSDPLRMFAKPFRTLSRKGVVSDTMVLAGIVAEQSVEHIVVGLPYELDGTEARSAKLARQIGEALRERDHAITYIDERYSSVEADRFLIQAGVGATRRKQVIDQAAACVILQSFLDHGDWTRDSASTPAPSSSDHKP